MMKIIFRREEKNSRRDLTDYQPKSGTKVAYDYAMKKGNEIINVMWKPLADFYDLQGAL